MDGVLDLWAREHYKSTITTFAGSIFRILRSHGEDAPDPREVTIGIFSHTKPIAKAFLRQIKQEFERNAHLKWVFDDVLWTNPRKESPKWTEDEGISVKRKSNAKENTVEAWGLVDGQPTSKHYVHLQYDDVVTVESVTGPEMMAKTLAAYEMSSNLGTEGGTRALAGTRYHFNDAYGAMIKRGTRTRIYPCTRDGTDDFRPDNCVLMQPATLRQKRIDQGPYTFGTQMLLNPKGDNAMTFKKEWIKRHDASTTEGLNIALICDPANAKRATNDYTSMWVIGLDGNQNYLALDLIRDRLNLTERTTMLFDLHRKWKPRVVGYEQYGMQADLQHIRQEMERNNYRFNIIELGGSTPKLDRIKRLIPIFEQGRMLFPRGRTYTDYEGKTYDLIDTFVEQEYAAFPVMEHDDMFDCLARIVDPSLPITFPREGTGHAVNVVKTAPPTRPTFRPVSVAVSR